MLLTLPAVRDNIRNRHGKRVYFLRQGDQLNSGARDFLTREGIEILPAEEAKISEYQLLSGGFLREKPEHMTHLSGNILVPKTHPRIGFRGKMDTLESELILTIQQVPEFSGELKEILKLSRNIIRCEVLEEPLSWEKLCGMTEEELHRRSHFPQDYYGQPHFMPEPEDGPEIARLNRCRCAAREAELAAAAAFTDENGQLTRADLLRAMNRMSSMLYLLMIRKKAEREGSSWNNTGQKL